MFQYLSLVFYLFLFTVTTQAKCVRFQAAKAAKLEKFEIPAKIKLLAEQWTPESGLVTAALKLKREQIKAKFKDELHKLYA